MSVTRTASRYPAVHAPDIPPLPYSRPQSDPESPSLLHRSRTAPPPVPPRPMYSRPQPQLPPEIPPHPRSHSTVGFPSAQVPPVPPVPPLPPLPSLNIPPFLPDPTRMPSPTQFPSFPSPIAPTPNTEYPIAPTIEAQPIPPHSSREDDELAIAIAISASESGKRKVLETKENDDLNKALELSRLLAESEDLIQKFISGDIAEDDEDDNAHDGALGVAGPSRYRGAYEDVAGPSGHADGNHNMSPSREYANTPLDEAQQHQLPAVNVTQAFDANVSLPEDEDSNVPSKRVESDDEVSPDDELPSYNEAVSVAENDLLSIHEADGASLTLPQPAGSTLRSPSTVSLASTRSQSGYAADLYNASASASISQVSLASTESPFGNATNLPNPSASTSTSRVPVTSTPSPPGDTANIHNPFFPSAPTSRNRSEDNINNEMHFPLDVKRRPSTPPAIITGSPEIPFNPAPYVEAELLQGVCK
jgi:hypothetical protein